MNCIAITCEIDSPASVRAPLLAWCCMATLDLAAQVVRGNRPLGQFC